LREIAIRGIKKGSISIKRFGLLSINFIDAHRTKIKFVLVGVWNTIFGYLVFVGLDILFASLFSKRYLAYMSAAVLSNILAIINAYLFYKYLTFQSRCAGREY
jgi:putative flippase GtrA